jgi:N-acetylmuramoyl-L-alanine amidase
VRRTRLKVLAAGVVGLGTCLASAQAAELGIDQAGNRSTPAVQATPASPAPAAASSLRGKVIVIDPGHQLGNATHPRQINRLVNAGGFMKACNTTGTSTNGGFPEATFTWLVAQSLKRQLRAHGAKVYLTRHTNSYDDWGPCVDVRGRKGNKVHAEPSSRSTATAQTRALAGSS